MLMSSWSGCNDTGFSTPIALYQFITLTFSLFRASAPLCASWTACYCNTAPIIHSHTWVEHVHQLAMVLQSLRRVELIVRCALGWRKWLLSHPARVPRPARTDCVIMYSHVSRKLGPKRRTGTERTLYINVTNPTVSTHWVLCVTCTTWCLQEDDRISRWSTVE